MRKVIIPIFITLSVVVAFGLGRWTAPQHETRGVAAAPAARPARAELGIGSCSATEPPAALSERVAIEP